MANISVFGLGYVGCVGIGCFAKLGHNLIGYDIDSHKVERVSKGLATIVEREIDDLMAEGHAAGRITATNSVEQAVMQSDISFLCVGTPNAPDGQLDLSYILSASENIGKVLRAKSTFHIVVIRSTVPPGTNELISKIIESHSRKKAGVHFTVVSNPEFLREGVAVADFLNPPLTVLGSQDVKALKKMRELYEPLISEIVEVTPKVAEIIKFVNNSYHALKVTFANEVGAICKKLDIDSHQVMSLFCKDDQLNLSCYYFTPGFAYGGSCLPKDLKGLNYIANSKQVKVPVLSSISTSNQTHIYRALERVQHIGARSVGIIGLTFKAGTDDFRNSAAILLAEAILGKGNSLRIYDRFLNIARDKETNLQDINQNIPHLVPLLEASVEDVVSKVSLVIITVRNPELPDLIRNHPNVHFLDLVRLKDPTVEELPNYEGFCW
ncbi:MAG: nucleotide sugar dehydrogenase [Bacillota bacterium]|jgi:GDP-mannose 6-dehydrogenase|nr:nucleotide sugar dehydrogenase [Bacillota bacterium]